MVRGIRSDIWKGGIALPNAITSGKHTHLHPYLQCRKEISWQKTIPPVQFSFSDLFHEGLHDGTASNAQNHELVRSRPVAMLKLNIIVTLNMLETNFATLHTKNTIVIKIEKWQIVLIEGLSRVAVRGIDHQQLLTEVVISNLTQAENYIFLLISFHCWRKI